MYAQITIEMKKRVIQEWLGLGVYPRLLGARNLPALFLFQTFWGFVLYYDRKDNNRH